MGVVLVAAAAVAVCGGVQVFASGAGAPAGGAMAAPQVKAPVVPGGTSVLLRTYINQGLNGAVTSGFGAIVDGPTSIHCAPPSSAPHAGCILVADTNIQTCFGAATGNRVAHLPMVDGSWFTPGPFLGFAGDGQTCQAHTWQDSTNITAGTHTVQTQIYTDSSVNVEWYSIKYTLYYNHST